MAYSYETSESVWRTWKPYAVLAAAAVGVVWWFNSQSPVAGLKDGAYACNAVFVNDAGKYEVLTDGGEALAATAKVQGGQVIELVASSALTSSELASLTLRKSGSSHFHVADEPATHSYNAIACDYSGR